MEILDTVTAEEASARPLPTGHTIWELVLHIHFWEESILGRLNGTTHPIKEQDGWQFEILDNSDIAWKTTVEALKTNHAQFEERVAQLSDEELLEKTPGGSDKYFLLHGVIQHDLYHGGQMAHLKRAIRLANPARN
jgi:uncharacterized damage-inducible protein DinB